MKIDPETEISKIIDEMLKNSQEASFIIDNEIANPYNIRCQKEDF